MDVPFSLRRARIASLALVALGLASMATTVSAGRAGGAAPSSASAVRSAAQEPAHVQADESMSLRQGTVGAIDARATRVQVQGIWIELVAGKTQLLRNGRAASRAAVRWLHHIIGTASRGDAV